MKLVPDIAAIVDREWYGAETPPSAYGSVEAVRHMPASFVGPGQRPRYWQVRIGGQWWGIRPHDPVERDALDMLAETT